MAFKLRSGNKSSFKSMGSSPVKDSIQVKKPVGKNKDGTIKYDWVSDGHTHPHPGGHSDQKYNNKPLQQKGPVDEKNPDLFEGEMEGTWVYEGSDLQERIIDLEERISFLVENDIPDAETEKEKKKYESAVKKLDQELAILQRERKQKEKE